MSTDRDLADEVAALRQELAEARRPRVGEHDEPCPYDNPAATWQGGKCVKPRGHEVHWNGQGDVWRADLEALVAERDNALWRLTKLKETIDAFPDANNAANLAHARSQRDQFVGENRALRHAAARVVQLATRDQVIATHAAIAELRRVLDGGGQ